MIRKRSVGLILSSFMALGVLLFSQTSKNNDFAAEADGLVGNPSISWNNVDYSYTLSKDWVPNKNQSGVPLEGYCILVQYESNIASSTYVDENLLTANIAGSNIGDHILINGVEAQNVDDVQIYCFPQNGFFLYVPNSSITFSDEYEYATIEVLEGMSIDGTVQVVGNRFEYRGILGSFNKWEIDPEPIVKIKGEFNSINWNNKDFSFAANQEWCGELMPNGSPKNGYCLLAFFNEEGKTYSESIIGDVTTYNRGVIGIGLNADYKIKVNGVNIVDVEGSKCYIYPAYGLFFYIPEASITYNETYRIPVISLEEGLHFNNVYLPKMSFEFRGQIGEPECWTYVKDIEDYNHFEYGGVAENHNNISADPTHSYVILKFGEYGVEYLKNDGVSSEANLVNKYSDCGTKITMNGVPFAEIEETTVSYWHGYCYVYIAYPNSSLFPSNGYKVVTLHIEQNTVFYDTMLQEVTLYLFNGRWIHERPETPEDSDYTGALTFSETFGKEQETLNESKKELFAEKESSVNSFKYFMDYKLVSSESVFVFYALGNRSQSGLRLVFRNKNISLYDATQGSVLLGSAELEKFEYDEWYSLLIYTKIIENQLSICVAIDDITYIHAEEVHFSNEDNLGNQFSINLGGGSALFKNAVVGADNKKPVLSYTGKKVYGVLVGSEIIDFSNKCSAYDSTDGNVTKYITYNWPEGSITDNKINKGTWEVTIISSDKSNNTAKLVVTVIATDKLDVVVTFDGENPINYRVGDHIHLVTLPNKVDDEGISYRFIGWFYNDRPWDFENDYVVSDMNLVSKYQETTIEYLVSFFIEGLDNTNRYSLYFKYGTEINMQMFVKDGYTLKAFVNNNEVETIKITEAMEVKLVYTPTGSSTNKKKGCGGNIATTSIILSLISGVAFILLVSLKKKGGKEHE